MRGSRRRVCSWILLLSLALPSTGRSQAGLSAELLFEHLGVLSVTVSPSGEWAIAHAASGVLHGVLAQKLGTGEVTQVLAIREPIRAISWIGADTFLLSSYSGSLAARLYEEQGTVKLERFKIPAPGLLVDPLPLQDDTVLWEFEHKDVNSVHRVQLTDLVGYHDENRIRGRSVHLGERVARIPGSASRWLVDADGHPRAALTWKDGTHKILYRPSAFGLFREVYRFEDSDEESSVYPLGFAKDGDALIVSAYGGGDTRGLYSFDPDTRRLGARIFGRDDVDITGALFDPIHGDLLAALWEEGGDRRVHYLDSPTRKELESIGGKLSGESLAIVSRSADRRVYVLAEFGPRNPGTYYLRDEATGAMTVVARVARALDEEDLVDVETLEVRSADGTMVEAFLSRPRTRGAPAPLVVHPHGGPIGVRDNKDYNPLVQYLASWGFAILQVNYRGSAGYGRDFEESGKKEWARGIEDDIDAAVALVTQRPDIDGGRVCVMGASYGGFSAVASVVRHEQRHRCAVTINGVSDIPLMFDTSDFADDERALERFADVVGDVETDRERLVESSPAYQVARIDTPVFVIYGTEDRRVDPDHSHRLILMLETLGKEHEALELEGAAHGFTTREWIIVARSVRRYLTKHLFPNRAYEPDPHQGSGPHHYHLPGVDL